MTKIDDDTVFTLDEGFGSRLKVGVTFSEENQGGGFVSFFDPDRDAWISLDFTVFDRVAKAVAKRREI